MEGGGFEPPRRGEYRLAEDLFSRRAITALVVPAFDQAPTWSNPSRFAGLSRLSPAFGITAFGLAVPDPSHDPLHPS